MSYGATHVRLWRKQGSASKHRCACGSPAAQWAYQRGSDSEQLSPLGLYSPDLEDYKAMCMRCHALYDKSIITHCPQGHPYEGDNVFLDAGKRKCRECVRSRCRAYNRTHPLTPEQRARKTELQRLRRANA